MSDDKIIITLDNHPKALTITVPKQVDGEKQSVDVSVPMVREFLPIFNVAGDTSLATLRLRAEACGLAPHGDKAAIVARAHAAVADARTLLDRLDDWIAYGGAPSVEAGKRGRPVGSKNAPAAPTFTVFDGTSPHTVTATQFAVYCDAVKAGRSLADACGEALAAD